jgi:hypothetical protein
MSLFVIISVILVAILFHIFQRKYVNIIRLPPPVEKLKKTLPLQKDEQINDTEENHIDKNETFIRLLHQYEQQQQQQQQHPGTLPLLSLRDEDYKHKNPNPYLKLKHQLPIQIKVKLPEITNDKQNVHDSGVRTSITKSINDIDKNIIITSSIDNTLKEIRRKISSSEMFYNDKKDALDTLDKIERNIDFLSYCNNRKEVDILNIVYNRISTLENKEDVEKLLFQNLAESNSVCVSGRIARIIDALNLIDENVSIKPMWVLRQEMLGKASNIVNAYQHESENFIKTKIRDDLRQTYVDKGLLTQVQLDNELNSWIDEVF